MNGFKVIVHVVHVYCTINNNNTTSIKKNYSTTFEIFKEENQETYIKLELMRVKFLETFIVLPLKYMLKKVSLVFGYFFLGEVGKYPKFI